MTRHEMQQIVSLCEYKPGWRIMFHPELGGRPYIQIHVEGHDARTHEATIWTSGKRYLSTHMCRQEVVGAVFALIAAAEEHERREWFTYRGQAIYCPHLDPDDLVHCMASGTLKMQMRDNPMVIE